MSLKVSQSEIEYNRRCTEEDRQREQNRQHAYKAIKATAHMYRNLPIEKGFSYTNSTGDHVSPDRLSISLC